MLWLIKGRRTTDTEIFFKKRFQFFNDSLFFLGSSATTKMRNWRHDFIYIRSRCFDLSVDYKDVPRLRKYVSERAKIIPRRVTGTCAFHQRALTVAIKRARHVALMPYVSD